MAHEICLCVIINKRDLPVTPSCHKLVNLQNISVNHLVILFCCGNNMSSHQLANSEV